MVSLRIAARRHGPDASCTVAVGHPPAPGSLPGFRGVFWNPPAHGGYQSVYFPFPGPPPVPEGRPREHSLGYRPEAAGTGFVTVRRIVDRRVPRRRWFPVPAGGLSTPGRLASPARTRTPFRFLQPRIERSEDDPSRGPRGRRHFVVHQAAAWQCNQPVEPPEDRSLRFNGASRRQRRASRINENLVADKTSSRLLARPRATTRSRAGRPRGALV